MNLREAGIAKIRAAAMRAPDRRGVATFRVRRKIEDVAVAAGRKHNAVRRESFDRAGRKVARDDAARPAVHEDQVQHLAARVHFHRARGNLFLERLICAQEQLLPRLPPRIKCARNLHAAERARIEQSSVFARKGNALRHALIDDIHADLRKAIHVGFARAEISALHRVIKQPLNAVAVIPVIFRGIDPALRGDRMRAPRAVLKAKAVYVVALLSE